MLKKWWLVIVTFLQQTCSQVWKPCKEYDTVASWRWGGYQVNVCNESASCKPWQDSDLWKMWYRNKVSKCNDLDLVPFVALSSSGQRSIRLQLTFPFCSIVLVMSAGLFEISFSLCSEFLSVHYNGSSPCKQVDPIHVVFLVLPKNGFRTCTHFTWFIF